MLIDTEVSKGSRGRMMQDILQNPDILMRMLRKLVEMETSKIGRLLKSKLTKMRIELQLVFKIVKKSLQAPLMLMKSIDCTGKWLKK